jgi:hypothetical protein
MKFDEVVTMKFSKNFFLAAQKTAKNTLQVCQKCTLCLRVVRFFQVFQEQFKIELHLHNFIEQSLDGLLHYDQLLSTHIDL